MADYESKYSGEQVEALLDQVASGNAGGGGGGGITVETDPIFSASPAASITEEKIADWDSKQDSISDLDSIRSGAEKGATAVQPKDVAGIVTEGGFVTAEDLAGVASSGSYDDLVDKPTFKTINNESIVGEGNITIAGGSGEKGEKGDKGDTGVGVQSVKQTTISSADGGTNVVTVTLSNGTTSTFNVKNGSKGSNGSNGTNGKDGADGEDGATFTPSVDSAGNLSWTNNKGLTNPPTVNIKGPKGDKGDAGEGGGGSSGGEGVIQWTTRYTPDYINENNVINLDPFVVYYGGAFPSDATIVLNSKADYQEWRILFYIYPNCSLNVHVDGWANGITPDISKGGHYELSIVENDGVKLGIIAHFPTE